MEVRRLTNLARLMATVVAGKALPLTMIKASTEAPRFAGARHDAGRERACACAACTARRTQAQAQAPHLLAGKGRRHCGPPRIVLHRRLASGESAKLTHPPTHPHPA